MRQFFIAILLFLWTGHAFALEWRQIQSANFRVIYPVPHKRLAEHYAHASERAFKRLKPIFGESPPLPLTILLSDHTDLANGSASFLPYPLVMVLPVLPASSSGISDYENWADELMLHELAHIFTFAPVHGFYNPLRWIFGNLVVPNGVLPRWYLEGLAVEIESRYTGQGRLKSASTSASVRALTLSDRWSEETLDRINESSIPTWPMGARPYFFGSLIWHDLVEEQGIDVIRKLNQRFARRLPFLLNAPFKDAGGMGVEERWNRLKEKMIEESRTQINQMRASGAGAGEEFAFKGQEDFQLAPVISPDGQHLAHLTATHSKGASIKLISRPPGSAASFKDLPSRHLVDVTGNTGLSWAPDSQSLIYDKLEVLIRENRKYAFRDLYRLKIGRPGRPERLTYGQRAAYPAFSPDGEYVVFVKNAAGRQALVSLHLPTKKQKTLLHPRLGLGLSHPVFMDDQIVVFVGKDRRGKENLYKLNLKTLRREQLAGFAQRITDLRKTPEGLLAAAEVGEVHNLYLLQNLNSEPEAVTNTLTEIQQGTLDTRSKEVIFSQLTGTGPKLYSSPLQRFKPSAPAPMPALKFSSSVQPDSEKSEDQPLQDKSYSSLPYLLPRYWVPFVYPVENGILFQGTSKTADPTGRHAYALSASHDSVTRQTSYGLQYGNSVFPFHWSLMAAETNELLGSQSLRLTNRIYGGDASFYLPALSNAWSAATGVAQIQSEIPSSGGRRAIERLGVSAQVSYNSADLQARSSNFGDQFYSLTHTSYLSAGDRLGYERTAGQLGLSLRAPFPARHSLTFQARGSTAPGLPLENVVTFGDRTIGGNYLVSLINSSSLLRGYPSGALVGRTLVTTNLEYRFPLGDIFKGPGTFPLFFRQFELAFFTDNAVVDGAYYSPSRAGYFRTKMDEIFTGAGAEILLTGTAAYHLPVSLTIGLYYGMDTRPGGGFLPFLSLGYVGHGGLDSGSSSTSIRSRPASLAR